MGPPAIAACFAICTCDIQYCGSNRAFDKELTTAQRDKEVTAAFLKLLTRAAEIDAGGAARRLVLASLVSLYSFGVYIAIRVFRKREFRNPKQVAYPSYVQMRLAH